MTTPTDMKVIQMKRNTLLGFVAYNEGEICGFEPRIADILIAEGRAVRHDGVRQLGGTSSRGAHPRFEAAVNRMPFLDFLKHKDKAKPDALDAAHARLAEDRAAATAVLDSLDARRQAMLLADAPDAEILALDREADEARIRLEKCATFEIELATRQSEMRGSRTKKNGAGPSTSIMRLHVSTRLP